MLGPLPLPQAPTVRVLDAQGHPVSGAIVVPVIEAGKGRENGAPLTAGADGTTTLPAGVKLIALIVRAPGRALDWVDFFDSPTPREVRLAPATRLHVRFLDERGAPAVGARVVPTLLVRPADADSPPSYTVLDPATRAALSARTGAEGGVDIVGLPQGTQVRLDVEDERFARPEGSVPLAKTATTDASPIRLAPGAVVAGRVRRDGKGVAGIRVAAQGQGVGGWGEATTDAEGRYRLLGLSAGRYNVALDPPEGLGLTAPAVAGLILKPGEKIDAQDFALSPGTLIEGRVVDTTGKPQPGAMVGVYGPAHPRSGAWVQNTLADADGRFRLRVPAGPQYVYTMDRRPAAHIDVTTRPGAVTTADLTVRAAVAPLVGKALDADGKPVAGARVWVDFARDDEAHRYDDSPATADAEGRFELPGDLRFPLTVRARKGDLSAIATAKDADALKVALAPGGLRAATGTILDADGKPIAGASVHVVRWNAADLGKDGGAVTTDAQGRFRVEGLWPDQEVSVDAIAEGFGEGQTRQTPLRGETTDLGEVRLPRADSLVGGRVEDEAGKPLAGVTVEVGAMHSKTALTDAQGRWRVADVPKGKTTVFLRRDGTYLNRSLEAGRADHVLVLKRAVPEAAVPTTRGVAPAAGSPAPPIQADAWLNAKPLSLAALRGRVVVLDFWAIWCGPCREELPNVARLATRLKGRNAVLIGLHDSTTWPKELTAFAKKNGLTYALAIDRTAPKGFGRTAVAYGVEGIPTMAVIDTQGKIAYSGYDRAEAERVVERLLTLPAKRK